MKSLKVRRKPEHLRCITRIDIPASHTHGWEVRVTRRGVAYAAFFSDKKHGGKRKALEGATVDRDRVIAESPTYTRRELARKIRSNNSSGITGVAHRVVKVRRGKRVRKYEAWVATGSPEPGLRKTRVFYVGKWGEEARELAIKQRLAWERKMGKAPVTR